MLISLSNRTLRLFLLSENDGDYRDETLNVKLGVEIDFKNDVTFGVMFIYNCIKKIILHNF